MGRPELDLEPDERLLARAPASFRGAAAASLRSTFMLSAARRRLDTYYGWSSHAEVAGFFTSGPEIVLGLTDSRLLIWGTTFWMSRAGAISARIPLTDLHSVATVRHGIVTGVAFAFTTGQIVEVEAMRGRRLRHLAHALEEALSSSRR